MNVRMEYDVLCRTYSFWVFREENEEMFVMNSKQEWVSVPPSMTMPEPTLKLKRSLVRAMAGPLLEEMQKHGMELVKPEPQGALSATQDHLKHATAVLEKMFNLHEKSLALLQGPVTITNNSSR